MNDKVLENIVSSILITIGILFMTYLLALLFGILIEDMIAFYFAGFASIIFTMIYCTLSIKSKIDESMKK